MSGTVGPEALEGEKGRGRSWGGAGPGGCGRLRRGGKRSGSPGAVPVVLGLVGLDRARGRFLAGRRFLGPHRRGGTGLVGLPERGTGCGRLAALASVPGSGTCASDRGHESVSPLLRPAIRSPPV